MRKRSVISSDWRVYASASSAARDVGLTDPHGIIACCKGRRKTAGRKRWRYTDEMDMDKLKKELSKRGVEIEYIQDDERNGRQVIDGDFNVYKSIYSAAKHCGCTLDSVRHAALGRFRTANGRYFGFVDELDMETIDAYLALQGKELHFMNDAQPTVSGYEWDSKRGVWARKSDNVKRIRYELTNGKKLETLIALGDCDIRRILVDERVYAPRAEHDFDNVEVD